MLNLSDKELDRLSREAAQEHDPGDVLGSRSWEKLEPRLDKDLGKSGPNPLRGVRRFPFYYVPAALLLVAGVFYFVKQSHRSKQNEPSGSPPSAKIQSIPGTTTPPVSSSQNPEHNTNSTPSVPSSAAADPAIANPAGANSAAANPAMPAPAAANSAAANPATPNSAAPNSAAPNSAAANSAAADRTSSNKTAHYPGTAPATDANTTALNTNSSQRHSANPTYSGHRGKGKNNGRPSATTLPADLATTGASTDSKPGAPSTGASGKPGSPTSFTKGASEKPGSSTTSATGASGSPGASSSANVTASSNNSRSHELAPSTVRGPRSLKQRPAISDSALRAYTAKTPAGTIQLNKNKSLRINRTLQFGLSIAPDFSSVNSLAGDKPGSTIGLTLDYQFANHWYLSTGLLLDRKNYAARPQDYHVPHDYYWMNNMVNIEFVKGSFHMLEIPLNLRYDFSTTGSTLFFASAGFSSYLRTNENCNYYFNLFGRDVYKSFDYSYKNNYLFSSVNLSIGVETGLSNNLSLLVAPYVKLPSGGVGFGQVQMSSVGINFALKFAPVISRKRK